MSVDLDEIIHMAREAGFEMRRLPSILATNEYGEVNEELERFAALVAAAEREACAAICARHAPWRIADMVARARSARTIRAHHPRQTLGPIAGTESAPIAGHAANDYFPVQTSCHVEIFLVN